MYFTFLILLTIWFIYYITIYLSNWVIDDGKKISKQEYIVKQLTKKDKQL